jgi:hypothetical protein
MKTRRLWLQALAVVLLGSWRLASPAEVEAGQVNQCGVYECTGSASCEDASFHCDSECPGYQCFGFGHFPCPGSYLIYCNAIE